MRVAALVSGGKDSCYNMMQCVAEGHQIVALVNLHPRDRDELDSYMYQTVGHQGIEKLAKAMDLPLYRRYTNGQSMQRGKQYEPKDDSDEVEDLYAILKQTKTEMNIEAVAVGAILSDYQRVRVENVCIRLNLVSLAYLWRRDQTELLQEMIDCQVNAIIIKVAALGLTPDRHLGKPLREMQQHLSKMRDKYGLNMCGEGGEYETFTLDCPLFKQRINIDDMQIVISSSDPVCPVGYINFTALSLCDKNTIDGSCVEVLVKRSLDYISDLNESSYSDLSDPDLSETELELIEKETRMRESMSKDDLITEASISRSNSISMAAATHYIPPAIVECNDEPKMPPSPLRFEREQNDISNMPHVAENAGGWLWVTGIQGRGKETANAMVEALTTLRTIVDQHCITLPEICSVTLYVRSMADYLSLNAAYIETFAFQNPPTRVCIECPLPEDCHVLLEAVAFRSKKEDWLDFKRQTMHVQGISHWAPANIGPYSQSTRVGEITHIAGQIALVPGSMKVVDGGIRPQCKLALRHISRIAKAMNAHGQLRDIVQGICFVTHPSYVTEARRQWERRTTNAIMDYVVVPALPRQALVEWQVWAHTHNDRFEYEETGCSVGDYTISIRRRWNYENNCAAIVCYVSTGSATSCTQLTEIGDDVIRHHRQRAKSITQHQLAEILTYTIQKLLKGCSPKVTRPAADDERATTTNATANSTAAAAPAAAIIAESVTCPAVHLKMFYQVDAAPQVNKLTQAVQDLQDRAERHAIASTVVPVCSLHNFSTFLSISAVRHE